MTGLRALPAVLLALSVRTAAAAPVPADARAVADRIGRSQVRVALKHTDNRGTLIDVHTGDVDQLTVIAVHGFRGQPADLSPLIEQPFLPWIRAWRGLASRAGYQRTLDQLELPDGVEVNVYAGGRDRVFRHSTTQYRALVERLRGRLHVFPGATHMSTGDEVAGLH